MGEPAAFSVNGTARDGGTVSVTSSDAGLSLKAKGAADGLALDIAMEIVKQGIRRKGTKRAIVVEHARLTPAGIPSLVVFPKGAENLPVVVFVHGHSGSKIGSIGPALLLAEAGFLCVAIDARFHGERRPEDFEKRSRIDFVGSFLKAIKGTTTDVSRIIDALASDPRADVERVGMAGISMGGFITFHAAVKERRIKAAVPLIGTPDFQVFEGRPELFALSEKLVLDLRKSSPLLSYEKLAGKALLVQNGAADKIVPVAGARKLDRKLTALGKKRPITYRYIEYPDLGHDVPDVMLEETVRWFAEHL